MGTPLTPQQPTEGATKDFKSSSMPNFVSFRFRDVTPPTAVYIQRDDKAVFQANTTLAGGDTVTLTLRLLLPFPPEPGQPDAPVSVAVRPPSGGGGAGAASVPQPQAKMEYEGRLGPGYIVVVTQPLALPTAGSNFSVIINLAEGYLLSAAVISANATSFGQTYVTVYLGRFTPGAALPFPAELLIADYPTSVIPVGWPGVPIRQTASGQGTISTIIIANPAAGANFTFTAQAGLRTLVHSVQVNLVTSATVATRTLRLDYFDSTPTFIGEYIASVDQTATQARDYTFALFMTAASSASSLNINQALPQVFLIGAGKLQSNVALMQAGDQLSSIALQIETWVA